MITFKIIIAMMLYKLGFKYRTSTGETHGELTRGYGKLDYWGYWEYPIILKEKNK